MVYVTDREDEALCISLEGPVATSNVLDVLVAVLGLDLTQWKMEMLRNMLDKYVDIVGHRCFGDDKYVAYICIRRDGRRAYKLEHLCRGETLGYAFVLL